MLRNLVHEAEEICLEAEEKAEEICEEVEEKAEETAEEAEVKVEQIYSNVKKKTRDLYQETLPPGASKVMSIKRSLTTETTKNEFQGYSLKCIVDSVVFSVAINGMTLMNTVQMGLEVDYPDWTIAWSICEHVFTAGFSLEMILKLAAFRREYFLDKANWLDCSLTTLGILDLWILSLVFPGGGADLQSLSVLRILRLLRLARVLKLVRSVKPLVLVIQGVIGAMSTTFYVFVLLLFIFYVFAIFLTEHMGRMNNDLYPGYSTDPEVIDEQEFMANYNPHICFGSMLPTMLTLFNLATLSEWQEIVRPIAVKQPIYICIFVFFACFVGFGVLNVLIGVICDTVIAESKKIDTDYQEALQKEKLKVLEKIETLLGDIDEDGDGVVSLDELSHAMEHNQVIAQMLHDINLPRGWAPDELLHMLDHNGDGVLQHEEFTTSFFRLMDSNDFQQICIMQASINQVKVMIKEESKKNRDRMSAMEMEVSSMKTAFAQVLESRSLPPQNNGECRELARRTESRSGKLIECTGDADNQFREGMDVSQKHFTEILDAAFTVMKASLERQLTFSRLDSCSSVDNNSAVAAATGTECSSLPKYGNGSMQVEVSKREVSYGLAPLADNPILFEKADADCPSGCQNPAANHIDSEATLPEKKAQAVASVDGAGALDLGTCQSETHLYALAGCLDRNVSAVQSPQFSPWPIFSPLPTSSKSIASNVSTMTSAQPHAIAGEIFFDAQPESAAARACASGLRAEHDRPSFNADTFDDSISNSLHLAAGYPIDLSHDFTFEDGTPQLGFTIHWVKDELPLVGDIMLGGAASARGVLPGDRLAECNGILIAGRERQDVLQLLGMRPLVIRMLRGNEEAERLLQ